MGVSYLPTLIIGIGGIGCRMAAEINSKLSIEDKKCVATIGMDTNIEDIRKLNAADMQVIRTSDGTLVRDSLKNHPEYNAWVPDNRFIKLRSMDKGAGQIRMLSRMAALASAERGDFGAINNEIKRITVATGDKFAGTLTVMIIGSHTGGTGAGLFLQLPYYIRNYVKQEIGIKEVTIRGLFIGPDITSPVQPTDTNKKAVRVNAYACLKELNALYMRQSVGNIGEELNLEYYNENRDAIPYDYLYLIEGATAGNASIEEVTSHAARMIYTLLFTPVIGRTESDADNFVLPMMEANGMNRYATAGLCRLMYPQNAAVSYVTRRLVQDLIDAEWTVIDNAVQTAINVALDNQKHDPNVVVPERGATYMIKFKTYTEDGGRLAQLRNDAYARTKSGELVSLASGMMENIRNRIDEISSDPRFKTAVGACRLDNNNARSLATAENAFEDAEDAAEELVSVTKDMCDMYRFSVVDDLFPVNLDMLNERRDKEDCIFSWFAGKHPVVARYLSYDLIERLKVRIKDLEELIKTANTDSFANYDFSSEEDTQSPTEALDLIKNPYEEKNFLSKAVSFVSRSDEKELNKLANSVRHELSALTTNCTNYLNNYLELETCKLLLKRMEVFSSYYELFFDTIKDNVANNSRIIRDLEEYSFRQRLGEEGVYCSDKAFIQMYELYKPVAARRLSEEAREAVFMELYRISVDDLSERNNAPTEEQKQNANMIRQRRLNLTFENAVVNTLRTDVMKNGKGTVCMNIRQALEKELALGGEVSENLMGKEAYSAALKGYIRRRIDVAFGRAVPMLNAAPINGALVYLALHPECAEMNEKGHLDMTETEAALRPDKNPNTSNALAKILIDEEFSPQEIVCFRTHYLHKIEELQQYSTGSDNEKYYHKRLENLKVLDPDTINSTEDMVNVINPHLDQRWHEAAYLPALLPEERIKEKQGIMQAFFFGLAMGLFTKQLDEDRDDDVLVWHYGGQPIKVFKSEYDGRGGTVYKTIDTGFVSLYRSLKFNGWIVKDILGKAADMIGKIARNKDLEDILEDIQSYSFAANLKGTGAAVTPNVLDVLLQMRESMARNEWDSLFDGLKETIWIWCSGLLEERSRDVNREYKSLLRSLCLASDIGFLKGDDGKLLAAEDGSLRLPESPKHGALRVQKQINDMLKAEYENTLDISWKRWSKSAIN